MANAKIRFIRKYEMYGDEYIDIIYESGRLCGKPLRDAPKTAIDYMSRATSKEQFDKVHKRSEIIYTA